MEITAQMMEKLNGFTRRALAPDEVYIFETILCDNEIDRDCERFTVAALGKLKELFVGKTGIFDHNPKGANQTARIFDTELVTDESRKTKAGENYVFLRAKAYMVRTASNADLIREIDGGIKKEVSVSCSCAGQKCSVCLADRRQNPCRHVKGRDYGGKTCHIILDNPTDAYEWSFVAVPAQPNAGVTKHFSENGVPSPADDVLLRNMEAFRQSVIADIVKMSFLGGESTPAVCSVLAKMELDELLDVKSCVMSKGCGECRPQLVPEREHNSSFKL